MKILEQFVAGKVNAGQACEDVIFFSPAFAAVIDGATAKGPRQFDGMSSGLFAAISIQDSLARLDPQATIVEFATALTQGLARDLVRAAPDFNPTQENGPSASVVAYSAARREVWRIGDASWAQDGVAHLGGKAIDEITSRARAAFLRARRLQGESMASLAGSDPGRALIFPLLSIQHVFQNLDDPNEPLAFGTIDGTPVPDSFLECWPVPEAKELVLASDGYPRLFGTLAETEAYLRACVSSDPLRMGQTPCTKGVGPDACSFDDRAYLRFAPGNTSVR